jgi:hypothetical protein
MPPFNGTVDYDPPAPNQLRSFLVENGGFRSLLVRVGANPTQTANLLFNGLGKGNGAQLQVDGVRSGSNVILFTSAS